MPSQMSGIDAAVAVRCMGNLCIRARKAQARQLQSKANINVFTVHEVTRVKTAQLPEHLCTKQHECAIDPIRTGQGLRLTLHPQRAVAFEQGCRRRHTAGVVLQMPRLIDLHRKTATRQRVSQRAYQLAKRVLIEVNIWVDNAKKPEPMVRECRIVVGPKTFGLYVLQQGQLKSPLPGIDLRQQCGLRHIEGQHHMTHMHWAQRMDFAEQPQDLLAMPVADNRHRDARHDGVRYTLHDAKAG